MKSGAVVASLSTRSRLLRAPIMISVLLASISLRYDALRHAIFVGFVFSMIFSHDRWASGQWKETI